MAAVTEGGRAYTAGEIAAMLKAAGFRKVTADKPDLRGVGIVSARKHGREAIPFDRVDSRAEHIQTARAIQAAGGLPVQENGDKD
jgi:hypothetical protein